MPNSEQEEEVPDIKHPSTHACTYVSPYTHRNTYICIHDNTPSPRLKKKGNLKNTTLISGGVLGHITLDVWSPQRRT